MNECECHILLVSKCMQDCFEEDTQTPKYTADTSTKECMSTDLAAICYSV